MVGSILLIAGMSFVSVMLMSIQVLFLSNKHHVYAFFNSCLIGMTQAFVIRSVAKASAIPEVGAYVIGGAIGAVCSMYVYDFLKRKAWITHHALTQAEILQLKELLDSQK